MVARCRWAGTDPLLIEYHDEEWGVPSSDERHLFEMLSLEGAQAGLSWLTILRKREAYRRAFAGFDASKVARFSTRHVERLMTNPGIVRNRLKITSVITNAIAVRKINQEIGSFAHFIWQSGRPRSSPPPAKVPVQTEESRALSRELQRRGFKFVGPTICYSFLQAVGKVNDHEAGCFRRGQIAATASMFKSLGSDQ